ncbi:hypothetical protein N9W34_04020 [Rickettsiales bacterium]|nr:hypothetical protein [Rickettsiales bacterium]
MQKGDKKLACKDIILEINEVEHLRSQAAIDRGISLGEIFMPICWVSGYMDSDAAIKSANARIDYLGHIYDLLDCGGSMKQSIKPQSPAMKPPVLAPSKPPVNVSGKNRQQSMLPLVKSSKMIDKGSNEYIRWLHEHVDSDGKIIQHSHPYVGPHRHE